MPKKFLKEYQKIAPEGFKIKEDVKSLEQLVEIINKKIKPRIARVLETLKNPKTADLETVNDARTVILVFKNQLAELMKEIDEADLEEIEIVEPLADEDTFELTDRPTVNPAKRAHHPLNFSKLQGNPDLFLKDDDEEIPTIPPTEAEEIIEDQANFVITLYGTVSRAIIDEASSAWRKEGQMPKFENSISALTSQITKGKLSLKTAEKLINDIFKSNTQYKSEKKIFDQQFKKALLNLGLEKE